PLLSRPGYFTGVLLTRRPGAALTDISRARPAAYFDRSGSLVPKLSSQSRWSGSSEGTTMSDGAGRVAGKVALVTGAARGQGRADAVRRAAGGAGARVGG